MLDLQKLLIFLAIFAIIALASRQIGAFFASIKLPLISGFLFAGILTGPYLLGLISLEGARSLRFIDEISLAMIAFAAGSELYLKELKSRLKTICWISLGDVSITFFSCSIAIFFLAPLVPFMAKMPPLHRIGVAILAGSIMVARSPSSAIAIIKELRAKGPFTQTVLGVTMIVDVVVIVLFSINHSLATGFFENHSPDLTFLIELVLSLALSLGLGLGVGKILEIISHQKFKDLFKMALILVVGYGAFSLSHGIHDFSIKNLQYELMVEPLLVCMIAGFGVTNFTPTRNEFGHLLHKITPAIYVLFFTLTGASLTLDILAQVWHITLILFAVRLGGIFGGSFLGGMVAKEPMNLNRITWMTFITQAGVGLGLAKAVAVSFPSWGEAFATVMISVIVVNQILGPPVFKWVLNHVKEAHPPAKKSEFGIIHNVIIFGAGRQVLALAHQLHIHGWKVKVVCKKKDSPQMQSPHVTIQYVKNYSLEKMKKIEAHEAGAVVTMLSDKQNFSICQIFYEHYGRANLISLLKGRTYFEDLREMGVSLVTPSTAIVSLLDHFVRTPSAVSVLLGLEKDHDVRDLEVQNPNLFGLRVKDLRLPMDILILSVQRKGQPLVVHGDFSFKKGDGVTMTGTVESLDELTMRFEF